jgi:polar amino acid transport system substrate-binding protein
MVAPTLFLAAALGASGAKTQQASEIARALAPTGALRVGLLMVSYFAVEHPSGEITGVIPDLAKALAGRLGVAYQPVRIRNPVEMIAAFRNRTLDATFIGVTADRAAAFDFGPLAIGIRTSFLVPSSSSIASIDQIDRAGVRIVVPQRSAQEAKLKTILANATMIPVAVENPQPAVDMLVAGKADAFSHVVPMLANAQRLLPGSRILPGSYYDVPIAIGYAKDRPPAVAALAEEFVADMKRSGFIAQAIARMGHAADGLVVAR